MAGIDRIGKRYWRAFAHLIRMPDPVPDSTGAQPPIIIDGFGVSGTDGLYWIDCGDVPKLNRGAAEQETLDVGQATLSAV
jgi:hypothetical protein